MEHGKIMDVNRIWELGNQNRNANDLKNSKIKMPYLAGSIQGCYKRIRQFQCYLDTKVLSM